MTNRMEKKRRLERAGFVYYEGWLPESEAEALLEAHREEIAKILAAPQLPRGRPRKLKV